MSTQTKRSVPEFYPNTANSGIFDAQRFTIGKSNLMHRPADFPNGSKVTALCGTYGWATETDTRLASWASGYLEEQTECTTCSARDSNKKF